MSRNHPSHHQIDQALRHVFVHHIGDAITVRWRDDEGWPDAGQSGTIVAAEVHGARIAVQGRSGSGSIPEWIAYCDLWIHDESPYRVVAIDTPALSRDIEAALGRLQCATAIAEEVNRHATPVAG